MIRLRWVVVVEGVFDTQKERPEREFMGMRVLGVVGTTRGRRGRRQLRRKHSDKERKSV